MPARRCLIAILTVIICLTGSHVFGYGLLSKDESLLPYLKDRPVFTFALARNAAAASSATEAASPNAQYTVESPFSLDFPKLLVRDTVYVLTSPVRWDKKDWLTLSVATAGVVAVAAFADNPVREFVRKNQNKTLRDIADNLHDFGAWYSVGTLGLFYIGGEVFKSPAATAVMIDGAAASLVTSGIIVPFLKYAIGRFRPSKEKGNHYFEPFSGSGGSMPSGETAQAFTVAAVIASHYDELWVKVVSYSVASSVGVARMYEDAHWTSGALAGALIGTAVGTAIVRYNDTRRSDKEKKSHLFVAPLMARSTAGISIGVAH